MSTQNLLNSLDDTIMKNMGGATTAVAAANVTNSTHSVSNAATRENNTVPIKRINRGFSARKYLRILTKNWDQSLLDKFVSDGKIKPNSLYEKNAKSFKRKLVEDDLSLWPQSYRFDSSWTMGNVDMRGYKFVRVREFGPNERGMTEL